MIHCANFTDRPVAECSRILLELTTSSCRRPTFSDKVAGRLLDGSEHSSTMTLLPCRSSTRTLHERARNFSDLGQLDRMFKFNGQPRREEFQAITKRALHEDDRVRRSSSRNSLIAGMHCLDAGCKSRSAIDLCGNWNRREQPREGLKSRTSCSF